MSDKPLVTGFEKIILLGLALFFGYGIYKNGGISMYEKTEETTIFDGKTSANTYDDFEEKEKDSNWNRKGQTSYAKAKPSSKKTLETDDVLGKLARTFSAGRQETARQMKEMGLSEDEIEYVNEVKKENDLSNQLQDARDWFNILKTSASTYGKVKSFIDELSNGEENKNVNELLEDDRKSSDFYKNLESTFGISEGEARAFSNLGKKKISDWAKFIEKKSKEQE